MRRVCADLRGWSRFHWSYGAAVMLNGQSWRPPQFSFQSRAAGYMSRTHMKTHALVTAAAVLLLAAGVWSVLRLCTFSTPPPESKWCEQLSSHNAGKRTQAYRKLAQLWEAEWRTDSHEGIGSENLPPDEFVLIVVDSLRSEADPWVVLSGLTALVYAPGHRDSRAQFETLVASLAMKQMDERVRVWIKGSCALLLWDFDALRGLPPSARAITLVRETLAEDCYPESVRLMLLSLQGMKSDLLPLKDAIAALQEFPEADVRGLAAMMLNQMELPITPEERRERSLIPGID